MESVAGNPGLGGLAPEDSLTSFELREKRFRTRSGLGYRIVYTVHELALYVLRVRGPGQPPLAEDELVKP